jgi:hypothetical protein
MVNRKIDPSRYILNLTIEEYELAENSIKN